MATRIALVAAMLWLASGQHAWANRPCPTGKSWDPNLGSCAVIKAAPRISAAGRYRAALRLLDASNTRANPKRGVTLMANACRAKHAPACTQLGFVYRSGRHVSVDRARAMDHYKRACELKDSAGCIGAGELTDLKNTGSSAVAAAELYARGCLLKDGKACYLSGQRALLGKGTKKLQSVANTTFQLALRFNTEACKNDDATACHLLGLAKRYGRGTKVAPKAAFAHFERGCKAGSGDACVEVARAHFAGRGTILNQRQAQGTFERACEEFDSGEACFEAGRLLAGSSPTGAARKRLLKLGERACKLDKRHCLLLARLHEVGLAPKNDARTAELTELACENGNGHACHDAAERAIDGRGGRAEPARAIGLYDRGCNQGYNPSCEAAAIAYEEGVHVAKNAAQALKTRRLACLNGYGPACFSAGQTVEVADGLGQPNPQQAKNFYTLGCTYLDAESCIRRAEFQLEGIGERKPRPDWARTSFQAACDTDIAEACTRLGTLLHEGGFGKKDPKAAARAFERSCLLGEQEPCIWLQRLASSSDAGARNRVAETLTSACASTPANEGACAAIYHGAATGTALFKRDPARAFRLAQAGCEKRKDSDACLFVAFLYRMGIGTVRAPKRAAKRLTDLCNGGMPAACAGLGEVLWTQGQHAAALPLLKQGCDGKVAMACGAFGHANFLGRGTRWNIARATQHYERGCKLGDALTCTRLGELAENGIGGEPDPKRASELYAKGCSMASSVGCAGLGRLSPDPAKKLELLERACNSDSETAAEGCRDLARALANSDNVRRRAETELKAFDLARRSASKGPRGTRVLATLYLDGLGVVASAKKARTLLASACDAYDPQACFEAGLAYRQVQAHEEAALYFGRACGAGIEAACERRRGYVGRPGNPRSKGCGCHSSGNRPPTPLLWVALFGLFLWRNRRRYTQQEQTL